MANHDFANADRWVDDRLAALGPGHTWRPDAAAGLRLAHRRRAAATRRRRRAVMTTMAAATIFVALPVTRAFGARCVDACVTLTSRMAQVFRADDPLATAQKSVAAAIGGVASGFVGTDASGARLDLSSRRGRVVMLNFWATWCGPCREEIPVLSELQRRFGPQGLDVIGVSMDADGWAAVTPFLTRMNVNYPIVLGNDQVATAYGGVAELPATFIIDHRGIINVKRIGAVTAGMYDAVLTRLLAKRPAR